MSAVLLAGVALNRFGAARMLSEVWPRKPLAGEPGDYEQMKLFVAGTAATFGAIYLYLFIEPEHVIPFLIFGAALKTWAFMLSAFLRAQGRLNRERFLLFGVSNLVVGALFWVYIAMEAG